MVVFGTSGPCQSEPEYLAYIRPKREGVGYAHKSGGGAPNHSRCRTSWLSWWWGRPATHSWKGRSRIAERFPRQHISTRQSRAIRRRTNRKALQPCNPTASPSASEKHASKMWTPSRGGATASTRAFSHLSESDWGFRRWGNHDSRWGLVMEASSHDEAPVSRSAPRIILAVEEEGISRRAAATRSGVARSTGGRTGARLEEERHTPARARRRQAFGADRGSRGRDPGSGRCRAGHHAGRDRRSSIRSPRRTLRVERGMEVLRSSRHHASKKTAHAGEQERPDVAERARLGGPSSLRSTSAGWCSSTRPAPQPRWRGSTVARRAVERCVASIPHGHLEDDDVRRRAAGHRLDRTDGARRRHGRRCLRGLRPAGTRPDAGSGDIVVMDNLPAHKLAENRMRSRRSARGSSTCRRTPRLQSDRDGLRQAQGRAAQGRRALARGPVERYRRRPDHFTRRDAPTSSPPPAMIAPDRNRL